MSAPPLYQLFWEFTLRCNLSCRHCGSECRVGTNIKDMPFEHIAPTLDEIRCAQPRVKTIVVTVGGEPLMRDDLAECGSRITRKGFYWGTVTNAMLLDGPMMRNMLDAGLTAISIDVDGLPDDHNWLRCNSSSFDNAYNAITHLRKARNIARDVITCVNPRNIHHLDELKRMLVDAGVRAWRCFTIFPAGRAVSDDRLQLSDEDLRRLMDFIVETRREGKIELSYSCEGFLGGYEMKVRSHPFQCQSGTSVASVRINGDISGCLSMRADYSQGNIYCDSFWDVWTNRFNVFRNRSWMRRGICLDCEWFDLCMGNGLHLRDEGGNLMTCHYHRLFPGSKP